MKSIERARSGDSLENLDSPGSVRRLLESLGIQPRKTWGQNFLVNRAVRTRIIDLLGVSQIDTVVEIGPGLGALTELLVECAGSVVAVEIDPRLAGYLQQRLSGAQNLTVVRADAVKLLPQLLKPGGGVQLVVGNLPYSCASALFSAFWEERLTFRRMVTTVQRELAERMTAAPGTKDYSSFSILSQCTFRIEKKGYLGPGSFYPQPRVSSCIIGLFPRDDLESIRDWNLLRTLTRSLFTSRRKTIRNNLLKSGLLGTLDPNTALRAAELESIDVSARAEMLSDETCVRFANRMFDLSLGG